MPFISMRKIFKVIETNKNVIIIVFTLLVGFSMIFYFQNKQNKLIEKLIKISEGSANSIQDVNSSVNDLREQIKSGDNGQADLISDYSIVAETPNFTNLTANLKVEIIPKEYKEGTVAVFYIDNQKVKLEEKDNKYSGNVNVSILKNYEKASVSFEKKSIKQNSSLAIDISFMDYFTKQCTVNFEGEKKYESKEYTYDGNIVWNRTKNAFDTILFSKLVRSVNGIVQWSKELPITNLNGEQRFVFQQKFPLDLGCSFELYIEQYSKNGFIYRYYIDGGSLKEEDIFIKEERAITCELVDKDGNSIVDK